MNSAIWSSLPLELLLLVMRQAIRDYGTHERKTELWSIWMQAVSGNRLLQSALMSEYWCNVHLSWKDLLLAPGDCIYSDYRLIDPKLDSEHRKNRLVEMLQTNESGGTVKRALSWDQGLCRAHYAKELRLYFVQAELARATYLPPSHDMIGHTLRCLLPELRNLELVEIQGPPSDIMFRSLASFSNTATLKRLLVGRQWCIYKYLSGIDSIDLDVYDWTKLKQFCGLKELSVQQLVEEETVSLLQLLPNLRCLVSLTLASRRSDFGDNGMMVESRHSPLQALFTEDGTLSTQSSGFLRSFPPSLRQLELQDTFYVGSKRLEVPAQSFRADLDAVQLELSTLTLGLDDLQSSINFLTWLPKSQLTRISFSPVQPSLPIHDDHSADTLKATIATTNEILSAHHNTLQIIMLTNAWRIHPEYTAQFQIDWHHKYTIEDLVLGTDCVKSAFCQEPHAALVKQDLKHVLFGCREDIHRWGSTLQRIRLEMPWTTHDIDLDAHDLLAYDSLKNLRMLIISPRNLCTIKQVQVNNHEDIAHALIKRAPTSLRFLQLCKSQYWIHYDEGSLTDTREERKYTLIPWHQAQRQSGHKSQLAVRRWLTPDDEMFIDGESSINEHRQYYNQRIDTNMLTQFWLQSFNFLIARPI